MLAATFILIAAFNSVLTQRSLKPELVLGRKVCQSFKQSLINPESYKMNPPTVPAQYQGTIMISNTGMPAASAPKTTVPAIPFVTELPNCPDICFSDILTSPIGCLDPILNVYGNTKISKPVSPKLPASTSSNCDRDSHFLSRVTIPPPFI